MEGKDVIFCIFVAVSVVNRRPTTVDVTLHFLRAVLGSVSILRNIKHSNEQQWVTTALYSSDSLTITKIFCPKTFKKAKK